MKGEREREREKISADSVLISELKDRDLAGACASPAKVD